MSQPTPPKFAIGEQVIVICPGYPIPRFETTVLAMKWMPEGFAFNMNKQKMQYHYAEWAYLVVGESIPFGECVLHKKPPKESDKQVDEQFQRFMGKLDIKERQVEPA